MDNLNELLKKRKPQKSPAYPWQELALRVINELGVPGFKRNSVFKACKEHSRAYIEACLNDTKELCKKGETWKYFFKVLCSEKKDNKKPLFQGKQT